MPAYMSTAKSWYISKSLLRRTSSGSSGLQCGGTGQTAISGSWRFRAMSSCLGVKVCAIRRSDRGVKVMSSISFMPSMSKRWCPGIGTTSVSTTSCEGPSGAAEKGSCASQVAQLMQPRNMPKRPAGSLLDGVLAWMRGTPTDIARGCPVRPSEPARLSSSRSSQRSRRSSQASSRSKVSSRCGTTTGWNDGSLSNAQPRPSDSFRNRIPSPLRCENETLKTSPGCSRAPVLTPWASGVCLSGKGSGTFASYRHWGTVDAL
mmetsp:Transcript_45536/g.134813  ORF Transcript_45536/g.134813 Transcript_45536/m.134813 type:complete len:261 (-) Transcript_45536:116-898(-)